MSLKQTSPHSTHPRIHKLTDIQFSREKPDILELRFQQNFEKSTQARLRDLMIDTETAISCVDTTIQNTFRHLAHNKMKQLLQCNLSHYILYKRQVYVLKQFCNKRQKHYLLYMLIKEKR